MAGGRARAARGRTRPRRRLGTVMGPFAARGSPAHIRAPCRTSRPWPRACWRATSARSRAASRSWRTTTRRAGRSSARSSRTPATRRSSGLTGRPGAGKSTLIGALVRHQRALGPRGRRAVDRPVVAVHPRRAARRPDPAHRALPRPGRVHPLDGHARRARRAGRGGAAGRAADGRRRQGRRAPRDGRRRPGGGRRHRPRRHGRARAHPGLRATRSRRSRPASWRSRTSSWSTSPITR